MVLTPEEKERRRRYYLKNADKIKQYNRNYYQKNKERYRLYHKIYHLDNIDMLRERTRLRDQKRGRKLEPSHYRKRITHKRITCKKVVEVDTKILETPKTHDMKILETPKTHDTKIPETPKTSHEIAYEKKLEKDRLYREKNREKLREKARIYRENNRKKHQQTELYINILEVQNVI